MEGLTVLCGRLVQAAHEGGAHLALLFASCYCKPHLCTAGSIYKLSAHTLLELYACGNCHLGHDLH